MNTFSRLSQLLRMREAWRHYILTDDWFFLLGGGTSSSEALHVTIIHSNGSASSCWNLSSLVKRRHRKKRRELVAAVISRYAALKLTLPAQLKSQTAPRIVLWPSCCLYVDNNITGTVCHRCPKNGIVNLLRVLFVFQWWCQESITRVKKSAAASNILYLDLTFCFG